MKLPRALDFLQNPERFMTVSRWLAPTLGVLAAALILPALWLTLTAPGDYQQGSTVVLLPIHVAAAWMSMFVYACLGGACFLALVFRQVLADAAAKAAAPLGAVFTALTLIIGSLWGRPMWGTWWVWDARITSVLILFLLYLSYLALRAAIEDETKASRMASILAMVGLVNLPIIHFSVVWWNSLHQGSSTFGADDGDSLPTVYLVPLLLMVLGFMAAFGSLWLVRIRGEVWRRRARAAALRAAGA
ncbi:MAG: heme transporter HemC [Caulobacterales bacterium 68-7]|nr:cytochrome c biogenesis protein CcsA [Caulobacterales bacterium]OJU10381.1 MAG: heme transporter HemC [Caulobacterales bacterium 68-7]